MFQGIVLKEKNIKFAMNKRTFIKKSIALTAGIAFTAPMFSRKPSNNENTLEPAGFAQDPLSYSFDALEPYIDAKTMELHYSKHHAGYTKNFNAAVEQEGLGGKKIEEIFSNITQYPDSIRNNGGGVFNHNLFWKMMSPDQGKLSESLSMAIIQNFGSVQSFKDEFSKAATSVFGSGWAWLIVSGDKLLITTTANQDNPLMDLPNNVKGTPILTIDVWEHAYYLNYQNRRADYINAFWNVVNWEYVSQLYF